MKEQSPQRKLEVSVAIGANVKIKPEEQSILVPPSVTWRALLELAKVAEQEFTEDESTAKDGVKGLIDHNSIWDDWEG